MMWAGLALSMLLLFLVVGLVTVFPKRAPAWAVWVGFLACILIVGLALTMLGAVSWEMLA